MKHVALILILAVTPAQTMIAQTQTLPLAGRWRFQLDTADRGLREGWFERQLGGQINLPGSLTAEGIGDDISTNTPWTGGIVDQSWFRAPEYAPYREPGNAKVPFWLQPDKYYAGAAWYQRDVEIPEGWQGRRVVLFLERAHWETRVWLDARLGTNNSLSTPHEYDLGQLPQGKHTLTIRVDNRRIVDIGENSHAISDHTQGNWNGIVGKIELRTTPLVWIDNLQVYPDAARRTAIVKGRIGNASRRSGKGQLELAAAVRSEIRNPKSELPAESHHSNPEIRTNVTWDADGGSFEVEIPFGPDAPLWDEFHPILSKLTTTLITDHGSRITNHVSFGFRNIATAGTQFTINGRKTFLRGTLECAIFPKTGHPPMDVESWRRIIRICQGHGLNLIRFHSWCPPEAAFQAADELGIYFQVETCWPNQSTTLGDGKPVDQWVYDETDRILKYYGNHPSFILMACGNEPGGSNHEAFLAKYVARYKAKDPRRLWTSGSGWPEIAENLFHVLPGPRIQQWGQGLNSRINGRPPETLTDYREFVQRRDVPVISHEIGQWCVYPNFDEMDKYTGYLKPRNFEIFRDLLEANHMGHLAKDFLLASGKLQAMCYKEEIESALRTPGMGGFQLLDLHDFPGQGTALVGVLDPFWEEKGYITAREYSRFCNTVVPLARLQKRVFTTQERLTAQIEVANFGPAAMTNAVAKWKLVSDEHKIIAQGTLATNSLPIGNSLIMGDVNPDLGNVSAPARLKFVVGLRGTKFENDWDVWVYPARPATEATKEILLTSRFDDAARAQLASGGRVLLTIPGSQVRNFDQDPVKLGFSSIFWNTAWTGRQAPTTLGILCDPKHPALTEFPTEFHSNWQWWYLIHRAGALRLDQLPAKAKPVVRVIDDWVTARPLGLIVEGRVGSGKIIVCGFDLTDAVLNDPVSRQMRASLLKYLGSDQCRPATRFTVEQIVNLIRPPGPDALEQP